VGGGCMGMLQLAAPHWQLATSMCWHIQRKVYHFGFGQFGEHLGVA